MTTVPDGLPAGFIPLETRSELPATESLRSPNLSKPLQPLSPPMSMYSIESLNPNITSPNAAAVLQTVASSSVIYPQDGPSELEAPVEVARTISLNSSANPSPPSTAHSWRQDDTDPGLIVPEEDNASPPSIDQKMAPHVQTEVVAALDRANALLRYASNAIDASPSEARKAFTDAIAQYRLLEVSDPFLAVRKYRSMANAELGLSLVVKDQAKHIACAETYCNTAMKFARRSANRSDIHGAMVDNAKVKGRYARLQEKQGASSVEVKTLQGDAFDLFQEVAAELSRKHSTTEDLNTFGQALLGAARMAKVLRVGYSPGARQIGPPEIYLQEALRHISEAQHGGVAPGSAHDRLVETRAAIMKMLHHR